MISARPNQPDPIRPTQLDSWRLQVHAQYARDERAQLFFAYGVIAAASVAASPV